jgi:hypothetical protein
MTVSSPGFLSYYIKAGDSLLSLNGFKMGEANVDRSLEELLNFNEENQFVFKIKEVGGAISAMQKHADASLDDAPCYMKINSVDEVIEPLELAITHSDVFSALPLTLKTGQATSTNTVNAAIFFFDEVANQLKEAGHKLSTFSARIPVVNADGKGVAVISIQSGDSKRGNVKCKCVGMNGVVLFYFTITQALYGKIGLQKTGDKDFTIFSGNGVPIIVCGGGTGAYESFIKPDGTEMFLKSTNPIKHGGAIWDPIFPNDEGGDVELSFGGTTNNVEELLYLIVGVVQLSNKLLKHSVAIGGTAGKEFDVAVEYEKDILRGVANLFASSRTLPKDPVTRSSGAVSDEGIEKKGGIRASLASRFSVFGKKEKKVDN